MLPRADIRFVWHETGPITADSGVLIFGATHTFDETPAPDVVLVPGGSASVMNQARDQRLLAWLRKVHTTSQWTTLVCAGSVGNRSEGRARSRGRWKLVVRQRRLFGSVPGSR
jgi:putative intracellular protease/amidase